MINSRNKGKAFERKIARQFRDAMPGAHVSRGLQGRGGGEVPDVDCPVFWVECKHGAPAVASPRKALAQAIRDAAEDRIPIAVTMVNRQQPIVSMRLEDFLGFVEQWWSARGASSNASPSLDSEPVLPGR